ncbi:hypothetical protein Cantr_00898 [Candida viswanathii]|uniref:Major facilitator superfamily (MFS) profile domain-containing protein n=1 Tax=Candida viswanathii TaxID=5486 RepID=A0A367YJL3_9ASCO|nr:hypothetical protein Cantr_00898 [Candida viswanathii]
MATRDLLSFGETMRAIPKEITLGKSQTQLCQEYLVEDDEPQQTKVKGYVNAGISTVFSCLKQIYGDEFTESNAINNISSIAFVGTVVGQLGFGYISDRIDRKGGMVAANIMLIFFTLMCAVASWGVTVQGFFTCLTVWRFFLGVALGAEYPTSSVIAAEFANQLPPGHRNRYFVWFTNACIDFGFVVAAFVPLVLLWIFSPNHLRAVWRLTIGLGVIPPLILFFLRLIVKFYWFRLIIISLIWFIYDFSVFSFGTFNTIIIEQIIPDGSLYQNWGWSVVFNLFYMPGTILGALSADYFGPRLTLAVGVAGFVVVFGIFTGFGEFGPGNNCSLLASKTSPTSIRGQHYGIAAAIGKIGAFVGTWVFPAIQKHYASDTTPDLELQVPFYVSSALCLFSAVLTMFFVPPVAQDSLNKEDRLFREYLEKNGFDTRKLGDGGEITQVVGDVEIDSSKSVGKEEEDVNVGKKSI